MLIKLFLKSFSIKKSKIIFKRNKINIKYKVKNI